MPTKIKKEKSDSSFNPPAIYERITDKKVPLAPSAWNVFQDFLKGNFAPAEETTPTEEILEKDQAKKKETKSEKPIEPEDRFANISKKKSKGLNTDIIWSGIAIGCLIGVIYFFFGGLQPLVLQNYIANAKNSIDQVATAYIDQVNDLSGTQTTIIQNTSYNIFSDCSTDQKYTNLETDVAKVEVTDRMIFPKQDHRNPEKFNGFSDSEVREKYQDFYNYYSNNLDNLRQNVLSDVRSLPSYATYRNYWIDGCILVTKVVSNGGDIKNYCKEIDNKTTEYLETSQPEFWGDIQEPIEANLKLCEQAQNNKTGNFLDWKVKWLSNYGKIVSFVPNTQKNIDIINGAIQDMKLETTKHKQALNEIYNRKTSIIGTWYLLEF